MYKGVKFKVIRRDHEWQLVSNVDLGYNQPIEGHDGFFGFFLNLEDNILLNAYWNKYESFKDGELYQLINGELKENE